MTDIVLRAETGPTTLILEDSPSPTIVLDSHGIAGPPGVGVIPGGQSGDVLVKHSSADYDTTWTPLGTLGGDKTFTQDFTPATSVTVTHGLNKYPAVTVRTSAGDVVIADIEYLNLNQVVLSFASAFGGTVICN